MPFTPPTISGKVCRDATLVEPYRKVSLFPASVVMPGGGLPQSTSATISSKVCRGSGTSPGRAILRSGVLWSPTPTAISVPIGRVTIIGYAPSGPGVPAGKIIIRGYAPFPAPVIPAGKIVIHGIPVLFAGAVAVPTGKIIITGKVPTLTNYVENAGQVSCCTVPDESVGGVSAELDNWAL